MKRDFLTLRDLGAEGILAVLDRSEALRRLRAEGAPSPKPLAGRSVALIFEKPSTRTRVSFEVAVYELGGHPLVLSSRDLQLGRGETIEDTARVLSRYVHAIVLRTFGDERLQELARAATVPVVNALSDGGHPCQVLADLQAVRTHKGELRALRYAWIGDGNNVARSWIEAAGLLGLTLTLACPQGYEPPGTLPAGVTVVHDPAEAAVGADVFLTDVWASMGQEEEAQKRRAAFAGYTVDRALVDRGNRGAIVLHCLPAHRGEEIAAEFLAPPDAPIWDEAENRLHTSKALLEHLVR